MATHYQSLFVATNSWSSRSALRGTEAGVVGLTHSCVSAFIKDDIIVNAIAPALIETEMVSSNPNTNPNLIPMGHFGKIDE